MSKTMLETQADRTKRSHFPVTLSRHAWRISFVLEQGFDVRRTLHYVRRRLEIDSGLVSVHKTLEVTCADEKENFRVIAHDKEESGLILFTNCEGTCTLINDY